MKNAMNMALFAGLMPLAQFSAAGVPVGVIMGTPLEMGGIAGVAALSLIIATQLVKRRK